MAPGKNTPLQQMQIKGVEGWGRALRARGGGGSAGICSASPSQKNTLLCAVLPVCEQVHTLQDFPPPAILVVLGCPGVLPAQL